MSLLSLSNMEFRSCLNFLLLEPSRAFGRENVQRNPWGIQCMEEDNRTILRDFVA